MNPWRAYLLLLQDFARWTGTYGRMISSDLHEAESPQMDVVTPTKGRGHQRLALGRKKDVALETLWQTYTQGDLAHPPGR
jgi:hypothetical protein